MAAATGDLLVAPGQRESRFQVDRKLIDFGPCGGRG
jgi:hypothetical protein